MAIFNETYSQNLIKANSIDEEAINESIGGALAAGIGIGLFATVYVSLFAFVTGAFIRLKKDNDLIKKALEVYPKLNDDCKPLYKFKKKIYTIVPYTDKPGEESVPKSRIEKFMRKHKLDYGDKCICYFEGDKLAMYYSYRVSSSGDSTVYRIKVFLCDDKYKKHEEYYTTHFLFDRGMTNVDSLSWAKKIVEKYESSDDKKGE